MKKKTKAILTAAVCLALAAGGFGVWKYMDSRGTTTPNDPPQVEEVSGGGLGSVTLPDKTKTSLGITLTGQSWQPEAGGNLAGFLTAPETAPGWLADLGWYFTDTGAALIPTTCFREAETGMMLPLCPQPQCLHDGSMYCTASSDVFMRRSAPVLHENALYSVAIKNGGAAVLLRIEPDGSALTELCTLSKNADVPASMSVSPVIVHRGWVWTTVQQYVTSEMQSSAQGWGGYIIAGYELATGKTITLLDTTAEAKSAKESHVAPRAIWAEGDFLYFTIDPDVDGFGRSNAPQTPKNGLYRISLLDGSCEFVSKREAEFVGYGLALYTDISATDYNKIGLTVYDINENTSFTIGENIEFAICDANYIYVSALTDERITGVLQIYDRKGTLLQEFQMDRRKYIGNLAVQNGRLLAGVYDLTDFFASRLNYNFSTGKERLCEDTLVQSGYEGYALCEVADLLDGRADFSLVRPRYWDWQTADQPEADSLGLELSGAGDTPAIRGCNPALHTRFEICDSEDAWFRTDNTGSETQVLRTDKATGETTVLPLEFHSSYRFSGLVWQGGKIYAQAVRTENGRNRSVLLEMQESGAVQELTVFEDCMPETAQISAFYHMGSIFVWSQYEVHSAASFGGQEYESDAVYYHLFAYRLRDGKVTRINENAPDWDSSFLARETAPAPTLYAAAGQSLLFNPGEGSSRQGLFRYDLRTGLSPLSTADAPGRPLTFIGADFLLFTGYENGDWAHTQYYISDLYGLERTAVDAAVVRDAAGLTCLIGDETGLYGVWSQEGSFALRRYSRDGKLQSETPIPDVTQADNIAISRGVIYVCSDRGTLYLSGSEWQQLPD